MGTIEDVASELVERYADDIDQLGMMARVESDTRTARVIADGNAGETTLEWPTNGGAVASARSLAEALEGHLVEAHVPNREDPLGHGRTQTLMHMHSCL